MMGEGEGGVNTKGCDRKFRGVKYIIALNTRFSLAFFFFLFSSLYHFLARPSQRSIYYSWRTGGSFPFFTGSRWCCSLFLFYFHPEQSLFMHNLHFMVFFRFSLVFLFSVALCNTLLSRYSLFSTIFHVQK